MLNAINHNKTAKLAYGAYAKKTGGLTWDKKPMPIYDVLPENIKDAWIEAVYAVAEEYARIAKEMA